MKTCTRCGETKDLKEFGVNHRYSDGLERRCKPCIQTLRLEAYDRSPEQYRTARRRKYARAKEAGTLIEETTIARRRRHLKKPYGITLEEEAKLLERQGGGCPICGGPAIVVDHCHRTGRVRGLLCHKCNRGLGYFHDDPVMLVKALEYLTGAHTDFLRLNGVDVE